MLFRISNYYKNLIWGNRRWFFIVSGMFFASAVVGVLTSLFIPKVAEEIIGHYVRSIKPDLKEGWELSGFIYQRNITITVLASLFSFFFGIAAVFVTFINGFLLGLIFGYPKIYTLANPLYLIALIIPHGVFEYFATFLSLAFGLRLGINWTFKFNKGRRFAIFLINFRELILVLILAAAVLLMAALIEGFMTKKIADCIFYYCHPKF